MSTYRGRLIRPSKAELAKLDPVATRAIDPPGLPTIGYDDIAREPLVVTNPAKPGGADVLRVNSAPFYLPAQIETPKVDLLLMLAGGVSPERELVLIFHMADIEDAGLVDAQGRPLIHLSDQLLAIWTMSGVLEQRFDDIPLFATKVAPISYGLGAARRNLLEVRFSSRTKGNRTP